MTFTSTCACGATETVEREERPNERVPAFILPPGWREERGEPLEAKKGERQRYAIIRLCPACAT